MYVFSSSVTFYCDDGRSDDGRLSIVGGSSLRISPVKGYDAALYTCRAFNLEDSIDGDATLTVQGALLALPRLASHVFNTGKVIIGVLIQA